MNKPTEPGIYWAADGCGNGHYNMIVEVWGNAPFLQVQQWRNGSDKYTSTPLHTNVDYLTWGPKVEFPEVPKELQKPHED